MFYYYAVLMCRMGMAYYSGKNHSTHTINAMVAYFFYPNENEMSEGEAFPTPTTAVWLYDFQQRECER